MKNNELYGIPSSKYQIWHHTLRHGILSDLSGISGLGGDNIFQSGRSNSDTLFKTLKNQRKGTIGPWLMLHKAKTPIARYLYFEITNARTR